jgi:threonine dehydrogenase-like Zn-dependent dehydrogenase
MITQQTEIPLIPSKTKHDENRKMMACTYNGKTNVKISEVPVPIITDATDVIVKVTALTVCGSDLHLYHNEFSGVHKGDILGHECIGIIDQVGSLVTSLNIGDRVVVSAVISCGKCDYCKRGEWSCCDVTNHDKSQRELYGHNTAGIFGYSDMLGGYEGCQAEYVRVPFGDVNCFKIPSKVTDNQALLIADVACTGYHGTELADVKPGDNIVVFGCGPVGLMSIMFSKFKGANSIVAIDVDQFRLNFAYSRFGINIINSKEEDPVKAIKRYFANGPDKVIDCVGFRFPEKFIDKFQRSVNLETDSPNIINESIKMIRKNGKIALIGDYIGYTNHLNIGAFMEKHLSMSGGQLWPHKYNKIIFDAIERGEIDPSVILTHIYPLSQIEKVYEMFDKHEDGMIKAMIVPDRYIRT